MIEESQKNLYTPKYIPVFLGVITYNHFILKRMLDDILNIYVHEINVMDYNLYMTKIDGKEIYIEFNVVRRTDMLNHNFKSIHRLVNELKSQENKDNFKVKQINFIFDDDKKQNPIDSYMFIDYDVEDILTDKIEIRNYHMQSLVSLYEKDFQKYGDHLVITMLGFNEEQLEKYAKDNIFIEEYLTNLKKLNENQALIRACLKEDDLFAYLDNLKDKDI